MTDSEEITIAVGNVNQAPVLNPIGNQSVNEGELLGIMSFLPQIRTVMT